MLQRAYDIAREIQHGAEDAPGGAFYLGDAARVAQSLAPEYAGRVSLVYLDPPFNTGEKFATRVRVGEKEWKSGRGSLVFPAYDDARPRDEYLAMMRGALTAARALMAEDALIFVHIDWRMHPYLRLLMDEIFGEANLLNEIVWAYQSGGRARRHFSRKHDIILLYAKSPAYDLHIEDVAEANPEGRENHMKRHVDADGRVYRSIRTAGRVYTYYDDDPVPPSDVWADVSHLQQKDPQRTGYDTQKPLRLLTRIVKCASRPGDIVMDLFAGSGTTLDAARRCGRAFLGADINRLSLQTVRRRLDGAACAYVCPPSEGAPACEAFSRRGVAFSRVTLASFALEPGVVDASLAGLDAVDTWAAGYVREDAFHAYACQARTKASPGISQTLEIPVYGGRQAIRVSDVTGRDFYYFVEPEA